MQHLAVFLSFCSLPMPTPKAVLIGYTNLEKN